MYGFCHITAAPILIISPDVAVTFLISAVPMNRSSTEIGIRIPIWRLPQSAALATKDAPEVLTSTHSASIPSDLVPHSHMFQA